MQLNLTSELVEDNGEVFGYLESYGKLDVKINGQKTSLPVVYTGKTNLRIEMETYIPGETTFEIEEGAFIKNPEWRTKVYRFTEGCKFVCKSQYEWVVPVETQYVDGAVSGVWHDGTGLQLNLTSELVEDNGEVFGYLESYGKLDVKINGQKTSLPVVYTGKTNLRIEMETYIPGETTFEIEEGAFIKNPEWRTKVYRFTEGCKFVCKSQYEWVVPVETQYVETSVSVDWYGTTADYPGNWIILAAGENCYTSNAVYNDAIGTLKVKIDGVERTVDVVEWYDAPNKLAFTCDVEAGATLEIAPNTVVEVAADVEKTYKFTEGCIYVYDGMNWIDSNAPQVYKVNVSANDGSSFSVEVNPGEDYYLPEKVNEKVVLGYVIDGVNYMAGTSITVNDNVNVVAKVVKFNMEDGAAIRVNSAKGGIKFTANINYDELASTGYIIEKVGFMIIPTDYLLNKEFEYENFTANHKDGFVDVELSTYSVKSIITATMIDLDESLYNKKFSARAYVKYTVDGESKYIYTDYDQDKNSRSCYEVALMALADPEMDGHHAELKVYCDNIIDLTEVGGQVSITQNEYSQYSTLVLDSATAVNGVLTVKISGINVNAGTGILYNGYRITEVSNVEKGEGYVQFSIEVPTPI